MHADARPKSALQGQVRPEIFFWGTFNHKRVGNGYFILPWSAATTTTISTWYKLKLIESGVSHKFSVRLRLGILVSGACVVAEFQISIPRKISDTPQKDVIIVSQSLSRSVIAHTLYIECGIQKWHLHQIPHAIPNWRCCVCRICLLTLEFWMNSGRNAARIANVTFVFHFNLRYSFLFVIFFVFLFFLFILHL